MAKCHATRGEARDHQAQVRGGDGDVLPRKTAASARAASKWSSGANSRARDGTPARRGRRRWGRRPASPREASGAGCRGPPASRTAAPRPVIVCRARAGGAKAMVSAIDSTHTASARPDRAVRRLPGAADRPQDPEQRGRQRGKGVLVRRRAHVDPLAAPRAERGMTQREQGVIGEDRRQPEQVEQPAQARRTRGRPGHVEQRGGAGDQRKRHEIVRTAQAEQPRRGDPRRAPAPSRPLVEPEGHRPHEQGGAHHEVRVGEALVEGIEPHRDVGHLPPGRARPEQQPAHSSARQEQRERPHVARAGQAARPQQVGGSRHQARQRSEAQRVEARDRSPSARPSTPAAHHSRLTTNGS